jgi:hypothetical protein
MKWERQTGADAAVGFDAVILVWSLGRFGYCCLAVYEDGTIKH